MVEINLNWVADEKFDIQQNGKILRIDAAPEELSTGFRPKALILSSLAGCTAIDIVELLKKMRIGFSDFGIDVKAEMSEDHPKVYHTIYLTYRIRLDQSDRPKMQKAVDLSQDKYCGVSAMIRKFATLHVNIEYL